MLNQGVEVRRGKWKMRENKVNRKRQKNYNKTQFSKTFIVNSIKLNSLKFWFAS